MVDAGTLAAYDAMAPKLAEYFADIGPRYEDVERAIGILGVSKGLRVVELGCGDGRDAEVIVPHALEYTGVDNSEGMLALARQKLPDQSFVCADMTGFDLPEGLDIVFAFASILHLNPDEAREVFGRVASALRPGGVFYLASKWGKNYFAERSVDDFGDRLFHYYNRAEIEEMVDGGMVEAYAADYMLGSRKWFRMAFVKRAEEVGAR